jgi:pimeloyl-ACP methyl ester carboxylesterase
MSVPLALLLMAIAVTVDGRIFAAVVISVGLLPVVVLSAWATNSRRWWAVVVMLAVILAVCLPLLLARAPQGGISTQAKAQNIYVDGGSQFRRYALGNLLPEVDQLMLMFTLVPVVDPLFTQSQASQLKLWTAKIYRELDADPDFHALGSALPDVYSDALGQAFVRGHSFLYVPVGLDRSRTVPALVFLHGSGGNFKAYFWILSQLADRLNMVVIAPSNGMGNWRLPESVDLVNAALLAASRQVNISPENIHIVGLSNGGLAVSQLASRQGARYRSLVFLSPVFDVGSLRTLSFAQQCRERSVFVLTGREDDRVPLWYVKENAAEIAKTGANVTVESVEGANHFLMFSHRDRVLSALEKWLRANGVPGANRFLMRDVSIHARVCKLADLLEHVHKFPSLFVPFAGFGVFAK